MLHLQYMGLLNTDRAAGPVQVFLQGKGTPARYVLDRLPPWIEALCTEASESVTDLRYIPGVNLALLGPKVPARRSISRSSWEGTASGRSRAMRPIAG